MDKAEAPVPATYSEGSIDRVALIDEEMFVTGMLSIICRLHIPNFLGSHWAYPLLSHICAVIVTSQLNDQD